MNIDTLIKITAADRSSMHGGNGKWTKGRWRSVEPPLQACERGLHVVTIAQAPVWLGPRIGLVEVDGDRIDDPYKVVVERARVTEWLDTWNERSQRLFAADCAEHVLPLFEKHYPNDKRPREAIEVARRYALGEATDKELAAARAAAWDAARDAARATAWATARDAAWDAARDAAWDAAWATARDAEIRWQGERLLSYLRGES